MADPFVPTQHRDQTRETAQFDGEAFLHGRVVRAAGQRQGGFKGRGYHFSPTAAWPCVQRRIGQILASNPLNPPVSHPRYEFGRIFRLSCVKYAGWKLNQETGSQFLICSPEQPRVVSSYESRTKSI